MLIARFFGCGVYLERDTFFDRLRMSGDEGLRMTGKKMTQKQNLPQNDKLREVCSQRNNL